MTIARTLLFLTALATVGASSLVGCADPPPQEEETSDEAEVIAKAIEQERALRGGSRADVERLGTTLDRRIATLETKKDNAKETAKRDVEGYSDRQWERSWFTRTETEEAIDARARDIFD